MRRLGILIVTVLLAPLLAVRAVAAPSESEATQPTAAPARAKVPKSLVIGIDGAMLGPIMAARTPHLHALARAGTRSRAYRYATAAAGLTQEAATVSGPGWTTALTGVWPDKHRVRDNTFAGKRLGRWPDYLTRAERLRPRLHTLAIADWDPIATPTAGGPIISRGIDRRVGLRSDTDGRGYVVNDRRSTDMAVAALADGDPDLAFVYLGKTDIAGHEHGSASAEYRRSLAADDAQIGRLLRAVRSRPTYRSESWQVIVVNDHGHLPTGGHGGATLAEREQLVIAAGGGIPRRAGLRHDLHVTDVVPTVYRHLGLPVAPGLDGAAIGTLRRDALADHRGWLVENARMPSGGDRRFRGWRFLGDRSWTAAERGQGRENFVRARGVRAVADSDEWDDVAHGAGPFDSTLVSPAYRVRAGRAATVRFQHYYQQDGDQRGRLVAAFGDGRFRTLRTYDRNASGPQTVRVAVPSGVHRLRLRFRYTGDNDWYWAVDDVRVAGG